MGWVARNLFARPPSALSPARRGLANGDEGIMSRLEAVTAAFRDGYHVALCHAAPDAAVAHLESIGREREGFAFEGAAMAYALMDAVVPRSRRMRTLLRHPAGQRHVYMIHVGYGWALAMFPRRLGRRIGDLDPLLRWLAYDGLGFRCGYLRPSRTIRARRVPRHVADSGRAAFDQGVGRSLWFVEGADPMRIAHTIGAFPESRRSDLWSGVGLASAYAGGVSASTYHNVKGLCEPYRWAVAQGAGFAAEARIRAGTLPRHTEIACRTYCRGSRADDAARVVRQARRSLGGRSGSRAYDEWRRMSGAALLQMKVPA